MDIAHLSAALRTGACTSYELIQSSLARIREHEETLHALITVVEEQALEAARQADREIAAGKWRGPLHGIPFVHKDNVCTRGIRTTAHSLQLRHWVPCHDAEVHRRLIDAGAILVGKAAMWEYAGGTPVNPAFPAARNPWNPSFSPGGSSSGSAAAVAAGYCGFSTGTDTGGSIRHPASVCGIVGLKPTMSLINEEGVLPLAPTMDHVGPFTRTVKDNALVLDAMVSSPLGDTGYGSLIGQPISGMTLGVPRSFMDAAACDADCLQVFEQALETLRGLGARVVDIEIEPLREAAEVNKIIIQYEAHREYARLLEEHPDQFDLSFRERLEQGRATSVRVYEAALRRASDIRQAIDRQFHSGIDAVVSVAREGVSDSMDDLIARKNTRSGNATRMYNVSGHPALVLPMGLGRHALPLGLQIAGPYHSEAVLFQLAAAYETAAGWTRRWYGETDAPVRG